MTAGFIRELIVGVSLLVFAIDAFAQTAFIAGKVTRDTGDAMAGAAVVVEELKREVRTGDGRHLSGSRMCRRATITCRCAPKATAPAAPRWR